MSIFPTAIAVLLEKKSRDNAIEFLSLAVSYGYISNESADSVMKSYKTQKYVQMLPALLLVMCCIVGVIFMDSNSVFGLIMALAGAFGMIAWAIASAFVFRNNLWNKYYKWYQKATSMSDLKRVFPEAEIPQETENISGLTDEQITSRKEARAVYLEKHGLPPEDVTDEDTDERIKRQMKAAGYTDEQVERALKKQ